HVRHQDVLPPTGGPRQFAVARLDADDHPFDGHVVLAGVQVNARGRLEPDAVAGRHDVTFVRRQGTQQPADRATDFSPLPILHHTDVTMDLQYPARQGGAGAASGHFLALALDGDSPLARVFALGTDTFGLGGPFFLEAVLLVALCPLA